MRQSSKNRRLHVLPDGNATAVSGAASNNSHVDNDHPVGKRPPAESMSQDDVKWLQLVADNVPVNIAYLDAEHRYRFVNENVERHYGLRQEEIIGKHAKEIQGEDTYRRFLPHIEAGLRGEEVTFEQEIVSFDGRQHDYLYTYRPHFAENGEVAGLYIIVVDITDRKRAETELQRNVRESELLRQIAVKANEAATPDEAIQACLDEVCAYTGWQVGHAYIPATDGELGSTKLWHIDDPERYGNFRRVTEATGYTSDQGLPGRVMAEAAPQWMVSDTTHQHLPRANARIEAGLKSGFAFPAMAGQTVVAVLEFFSPQAIEPDPQILTVTAEIGILIGQVVERKQAADAFRESEAHLRAISDNSPAAIFLKGTEGRFITANQVWHDTYNPTGVDITDKTVHDFVPPNVAAGAVSVDAKILATGEPVVEEQYLPSADGEAQYVLSTKFPVRDNDGNIIAIGGVNTDITGRVAAERALRESEERFRGVIENSPAALSLKDLEGRFQLVNPKFTEWFGLQPEEVIGRTPYDVFPNHSLDVASSLERKVMETGQTHDLDRDVPFADGTLHSLSLTKFPVLGPDNKIIGIGTINSDVTEHRQTEMALRQAQKMEVVGQLTGGVAHDFNNLLAVVIGNLEMATDHFADTSQVDTPVFDFVRNAFKAAERGAALTHHLLAFARQQVLRPEETDLGQLIADTNALMSVSLGERITVEIKTPDNPWHCKVDQAQLQNAILNLSINARDAMKGRGELTMSTENVRIDAERAEALELEAGDYVCLSVSDNGPGIPDDVIEHIYEPFYTTKDVGEGSGLGLSMVYGFAQQSGGAIDIETEVGEGTTINLYFPAIVSATVTAVEEAAQPQDKLTKPDATILLVEDNAAFREITRTILESLNFRVIDFGSAEEALSVIGDTTPFDLLLSDIVLPGEMNGHDLAGYATSARPGLKTILMSAHAGIKLNGGIIDHNVAAFLPKPHRKTELEQTLHRVLEIDTLAT